MKTYGSIGRRHLLKLVGLGSVGSVLGYAQSVEAVELELSATQEGFQLRIANCVHEV